MAPPPIVLIPTDNTVENPRFLFGVIAFQPDLVEGTPGALAINILDTKWPVLEESGYLIELPPEVTAGLAGFLARVPTGVEQPGETIPVPMASETGNAADAFTLKVPPEATSTPIDEMGNEELTDFTKKDHDYLVSRLGVSTWPVKSVVWGSRLVRINPENGWVECSRRDVHSDFEATAEFAGKPIDKDSPIVVTYENILKEAFGKGAGAEHLCVVGDVLVVKNKDGKWWTLSDFTDRAPLMAMPAPNDSPAFYRPGPWVSGICPICGLNNASHRNVDFKGVPALWCDVGNAASPE